MASEVIRLSHDCPHCGKRLLAIIERRRDWAMGEIRYLLNLIKA